MLLAIDIGNTNITLGVFKYESNRPVKGPVKVWRLSTDKSKTADEFGSKILDFFHYSMLESNDIKAVAVANVVPALNAVFEEVSVKYFGQKPFYVSGDKQDVVQNLYEDPGEVGADRIANAAAAYAFFGGPAIVIDFGTATTFDCIGKNGSYIGGVIVPGPMLGAEALAEKTAKLPKVEIVKPQKVIGKNTVTSMQSGLYYGYTSLIRGILDGIKKEMKGAPVIIATGGLAGKIIKELKEVKAVIPELTLEGIRIIYLKSKKT